MRIAPVLALSLLAVACDARSAATTSSTRTDEFSLVIPAPLDRPRDLFFVVDAISTTAERTREADLVATIVGGLVSGDVDGDGAREITPVGDVRVMIVPNDPTILRPEEIPEFEFEFARGDDPEAFVRTVRAAAMHPLEGGAGWPQPLEAALFAITQGCVPRIEASVGVVFVTTADDCSLADPELADPNSSRYAGTPAERCVRYADTALQPMARYAPLLGRAERPDFAVAVIAGNSEVDAAHRHAEPVALPFRTAAACTTPAGVEAAHATRLATLVHGDWLGVVDSICADDHIEALRPFLVALGPSTQPRGCLQTFERIDFANCELFETFFDDAVSTCSPDDGRAVMTNAFEGRPACLVSRASSPDDGAPGWIGTNGGGPSWECEWQPSVQFTRSFRHRPGAMYALRCAR